MNINILKFLKTCQTGIMHVNSEIKVMANIKTDIAKYEKQKISRTDSPKSTIGFAVLPLIVLSHYRYYRTCMYCGLIKEI